MRPPVDGSVASKASAALRIGLIVLAVFGTAFAFGSIFGEGRAAEPEPEQEIGTIPFVVDMTHDEGFELAPGADIRYEGRASATVVRMGVYQGSLSEDRVRRLLDRGKGDALEWRLKKEHLATLRAELAELGRSLREVVESLSEEEVAAKQALRDAGRDIWKIGAKFGTPEFEKANAELLAVANPLLAKRQANVASESREGVAQHYLIRRADFPAYFEYSDLQVELLRERATRVREILARLFDKHGMDIFDPQAEALSYKPPELPEHLLRGRR